MFITDSHIVEGYAYKFYEDKIAISPADKMYIVWTQLTAKDTLSDYVGVLCEY